jgi:hypothetical protein
MRTWHCENGMAGIGRRLLAGILGVFAVLGFAFQPFLSIQSSRLVSATVCQNVLAEAQAQSGTGHLRFASSPSQAVTRLVYLPVVLCTAVPSAGMETPTPTATGTVGKTPTPTGSPAITPSATSTQTATPTQTVNPGAELRITGIQAAGSDEYVEITNQGMDSQVMTGWSIQSYSGTSCQPVDSQIFDFPAGFSLPGGQSVRVHSGQNALDSPPADLFWTEASVWNDTGDRGDLRSTGGDLIDTYGYGRCQ